jgi:hypothetical protein
LRDNLKSELKVKDNKVNTSKYEKPGAGQMLTNIVSFDHLLIMEEIIKMKEDPTMPIDFDLTDNIDEVVLLNLAHKNKDYDMLACLVKLGL